MKKNLLYSLAAAGTILIGGLTAYAVSEITPKKLATRADDSGWVCTPENGGSTATLPNKPTTKAFTSITLCAPNLIQSGEEGYFMGSNKDKVKVTYAGNPLEYNTNATLDDDWLEEGETSTGWAASGTENGGIEIKINYHVFTQPGELVIELQEGAFEGYDSEEPCPAYTYRHTFGEGGDTPETPVQVAVKNCKPAAEATVKTLSKVTLRFDVTKIGDNQVFCDATKADQITLTKTGATEPIKATDVAFDEMAWEEETMPYTITFPETTEAGEYTVTVPAGFFWAAAEEGAKPADAAVNDEITVKYTIDPNAKSGIQVYTVLAPEQSPATVESISEVVIDFPEVQMISFAEETQATLTKDGEPIEGVTCNLSYNWEYGNMHTASVTFEKDEDSYVIREDGNYELKIGAASILSGDETCDEIIAKFIVKSEPKVYTWTATPENNGKIELPTEDSYTTFTFKINGAEEVSYDEWVDPNYDPTQATIAKAIQVTYNDESVKNVSNVAAGGADNIGYSVRDNWGEPEIIIGVSNKVFTKGGVLKIVIDEGFFTADGTNPTPAIDYTCTVGEIQQTKDYEVKVSPAMDIDTEYLIDYFKDGFKIEFTNAKTVVPNMVRDYDDDDNPIMVFENPPHLQVGEVVYYGSVNCIEVKDAQCPTFIITYPDMFDIDTSLGGLINFSVDEGTFTVDGEYNSPAISQTWRLKRTKEVDTSYTFGPIGDIVNEGYGLFPTISFNSDEFISLDRSNVVVKFNDEVLTTSDYALTVMNGENKCLYFQLENGKYKDPTLTGSITIEIPANAVTVSGVKIAEPIVHTWNVVLPKSFTYKAKGFVSKYIAGPTYDYMNPALTEEKDIPEVSDLSEIIFEIPDAKTATLWNKNYINLRSRDYMTYGAHVPEVEEVVGAEHPTFKFKFADAPTEEAIYELSLNLSAFNVDNAHMTPNLDFVVKFKKGSGVNEIGTAADATYTVVTVDGKVILTNGTLDQVKALAKGLYIINGKKQIIK